MDNILRQYERQRWTIKRTI